MKAIAAMVCIAAAQLVACDYVRQKVSLVSNHEAKPAAPIVIPAGEPEEILQNALEAQRQVISLRVRHTDMKGSAKRTLLTEWTPDRTHTITVEQIPDTDPPPETIEIGPKTYKKLRIGFWSRWQEMNYAGRKVEQPNIFKAVAKFKEFKNGMFLGVEELDGAQMFRETWNAIDEHLYRLKITFQWKGAPYSIEIETVAEWVNLAALDAVNQLIIDSGIQFHVYLSFDHGAYIVALTSQEKDALENKRRWKFSA